MSTTPETAPPTDGAALAIVVAAHEEAERIGATVAALRATFPGAAIWVGDDASQDRTGERAMVAGAQVVTRRKPHGKGGNVTAACEAALSAEPAPRLVLLCDGDLGESACRLGPLVDAVRAGECDLAVAEFARRVGGGFGVALGFARWAERRLCGFEARAPISGQRALRADALRAVLPFARGFGMEIGMTVDAVRAGYRVGEYEIDLSHRATRRDPSGFLHRAVQLRDFALVTASRALHPRRSSGPASRP
ncbi:MAG TPA: glycosyltransferase [Solirubrobacterales bacterium]|nr:glycosyltransferase [Solirubrobacterales bacterium]